jgi:hypothetical protein
MRAQALASNLRTVTGSYRGRPARNSAGVERAGETPAIRDRLPTPTEQALLAADADTVPFGSMRKIVERGPTGHTRTSFVGPRPFTDDHRRPCRRVVGWGAATDTTSPYAGVLARANRELAGR